VSEALRREAVVLRAEDATATIDPDGGGRLLSVEIGGLELLQPPRPMAGVIPTFGSFLLAPWVGELFEGRLRFAEREYQLPVNVGRHATHGLVFDGAWEVETRTDSRLRLRRELGSPWPFGGVVRQHFALGAGGLLQEAEIQAVVEAMPAAIGWHPWFRATGPANVLVQVDAAHHAELDAELIPTGTLLPVAGEVDLRSDEPFGDRRIDVVYTDARSPARLTVGDREIEIAFDPLISTLVVYSADGTICVEPWTSWPDAVRGSARGFPTGNVVLQPHETMRSWMRWSW
jgi:aldose 1-epimerase